jgi:hypothetical protein
VAKLDGTEKIEAIPFDGHEQVVRGPHEHTKEGYVAKEYEPAEYPKAVAHDPESGEPIVANNAEHEEQLLAELEEKK